MLAQFYRFFKNACVAPVQASTGRVAHICPPMANVGMQAAY